MGLNEVVKMFDDIVQPRETYGQTDGFDRNFVMSVSLADGV